MRKYQTIGEFTLTGETMRITDPFYERKVSCTATVKNCLSGRWECATLPIKDDETRVGMLTIKHESVKKSFNHLCKKIKSDEKDIFWPNDSHWLPVVNLIGVDTARCGFYDDARYKDRDKEMRLYGVDYGICTRSGWGDGLYFCLRHVNREGKIDAFALIFDELEDEKIQRR